MKRLFAVLLLASTIVNVGAQQTLAHASLVSANPTVSKILTKQPTQIKLTFDDNLMKLGNSNQIKVTDASGVAFTKGQTLVKDATVSVQLKKLTHFGRYKILYRVVSADGHPVSAFYYFYFRKTL